VIKNRDVSRIISPAKINLSLEILKKQEDGYHDLATVFQEVALSDILNLEWGSDESVLDCDVPTLPTDEKNLIVKALHSLEKFLGSPLKSKIFLEKKVPMGAGLGGGSSNAAIILREAQERYSTPFGKLLELAAPLGADVPFFLHGGTAFGQRRGDVLTELPKLPHYPLVIIKPPFSISTPFAYSQVKAYSDGKTTEKLVNVIRKQDFEQIFNLMTNDFERVLFPIYPELAHIKATFL